MLLDEKGEDLDLSPNEPGDHLARANCVQPAAIVSSGLTSFTLLIFVVVVALLNIVSGLRLTENGRRCELFPAMVG